MEPITLIMTIIGAAATAAGILRVVDELEK